MGYVTSVKTAQKYGTDDYRFRPYKRATKLDNVYVREGNKCQSARFYGEIKADQPFYGGAYTDVKRQKTYQLKCFPKGEKPTELIEEQIGVPGTNTITYMKTPYLSDQPDCSYAINANQPNNYPQYYDSEIQMKEMCQALSGKPPTTVVPTTPDLGIRTAPTTPGIAPIGIAGLALGSLGVAGLGVAGAALMVYGAYKYYKSVQEYRLEDTKKLFEKD